MLDELHVSSKWKIECKETIIPTPPPFEWKDFDWKILEQMLYWSIGQIGEK